MEHSRVCARIDLDAVGANLEAMRQKLKKETRIIAVIKTNAYGHGAVQIARMVQEYAYLWGFAVAVMFFLRIMILSSEMRSACLCSSIPWRSG